MAQEEFGKSVSELNDAQYDWIDQIMHDYGNDLDRSKKPSSESYDVKDENFIFQAYQNDLDEAQNFADKLHGVVTDSDTGDIVYKSPKFGTGAPWIPEHGIQGGVGWESYATEKRWEDLNLEERNSHFEYFYRILFKGC